ncbi:MAG: thioredoxin TrxC [Dokdonella sp.]
MNATPILIPCPHCAAMNRAAASRLDELPTCGRCHQALFTGKPIALTGADFDKHALRSELPLLVDFWAPWCGPCLSMAPAFEAAAKALEPRMRLAKVDTEAEPALGARFAIRSIPTMILFAGGREIARQSGAMSAEQIQRWARTQLPQA